MNCFKVKRLLSSYVDKELLPDEMASIRNHLFNCNACRMEFEEMNGTKSALSSLAPAEPSDELLKLIACKPWQLAEEPRSTGGARSRFNRLWLIPALTGLMGVMALTLMTIIPRTQATMANVPEDQKRVESFTSEHERFQASSSFFGGAGADSTGDSPAVASEPGESFVVYVSQEIVR